MTLIQSILWLGLWLLLSGVYIYVARHFNIVDHPNHRSSHQHVTIRGGGIVFWVGIMVSTFIFNQFTVEFGLAIGLLGLASFVDDLFSIPAIARIIVQLVAVLLLLLLSSHFNTLLSWSWMTIPISLVIILGALNIYNFMDGINGLNVCYTLLGLISLFLIDQQNADRYLFVSIPLIAMAVFNVRPKGGAVFFSGDIGSITSGFLLIYCISILCIQQSSIVYLSLIILYLVDGGWTIVIRLLKKENIFEAHRSHIFQLLANELEWGHLKVVFVYVAIQLFINILLYFELAFLPINSNLWFVTMFLIASMFYFAVRHYIKTSMMSLRKGNTEL
ncbi:MAG: hypothetical protein RIF33_14960 [Cyclobacteriaceae bacterium]